jgi:hypothetical protein
VVVWLEGIIKQLILAKQMFVNGSFIELFVFIHWRVFGDAWIYCIAFELNFSSKIDFVATQKIWHWQKNLVVVDLQEYKVGL